MAKEERRQEKMKERRKNRKKKISMSPVDNQNDKIKISPAPYKKSMSILADFKLPEKLQKVNSKSPPKTRHQGIRRVKNPLATERKMEGQKMPSSYTNNSMIKSVQFNSGSEMGDENIAMAESTFFMKDMGSYQQFSAETKSTQSPISKFLKNSAGGARNDKIKRYLRDPNPNLIHLKSVEQNIQENERLRVHEKKRVEQHQEELIRNSRNYLQNRGLRNRLMSNPTNYS